MRSTQWRRRSREMGELRMDQRDLGLGPGQAFGATMDPDAVDLCVRTGTVLGPLGPNGAGKTTAVGVEHAATSPG